MILYHQIVYRAGSAIVTIGITDTLRYRKNIALGISMLELSQHNILNPQNIKYSKSKGCNNYKTLIIYHQMVYRAGSAIVTIGMTDT